MLISATALKCYACNEANDRRCETDPAQYQFLVDCPNQYSSHSRYRCLKSTSRVTDRGYVTKRGCISDSLTCDYLQRTAPPYEQVISCDFCDYDQCNSASTSKAQLATVAVVIMTFFKYFKSGLGM
uniref:Protein sleepless n=1 Tax=Trichogramma kaykai TaxID=54128 RepID=A0ABD2VT12_9HYME